MGGMGKGRGGEGRRGRGREGEEIMRWGETSMDMGVKRDRTGGRGGGEGRAGDRSGKEKLGDMGEEERARDKGEECGKWAAQGRGVSLLSRTH